jgi:hypothetical protein
MKKMCLITPAVALLTVTVDDWVTELLASTAAVAVYVVVADGFTVAVPVGSVHGLQTAVPLASVTEIEVAVPFLTSQLKVEDCPGAIVLGEAIRVSVNGTVIVTDCGAEVPPGPVAVIV